jgi:hypothetical protein
MTTNASICTVPPPSAGIRKPSLHRSDGTTVQNGTSRSKYTQYTRTHFDSLRRCTATKEPIKITRTESIQYASVTVLRVVPKDNGTWKKNLHNKKLGIDVLPICVSSVTENNRTTLTILQRRATSPPSCINVPTPSRILMCVKPISCMKHENPT